VYSQQISKTKLPGSDHLHPRFLCETRDVIAYPLSLIFSISVETSILPGDRNLAEVTAIYKKGPKHDRGNYRPVSLTSVCCKILESIIIDLDLIKIDQHQFSYYK